MSRPSARPAAKAAGVASRAAAAPVAAPLVTEKMARDFVESPTRVLGVLAYLQAHAAELASNAALLTADALAAFCGDARPAQVQAVSEGALTVVVLRWGAGVALVLAVVAGDELPYLATSAPMSLVSARIAPEGVVVDRVRSGAWAQDLAQVGLESVAGRLEGVLRDLAAGQGQVRVAGYSAGGVYAQLLAAWLGALARPAAAAAAAAVVQASSFAGLLGALVRKGAAEVESGVAAVEQAAADAAPTPAAPAAPGSAYVSEVPAAVRLGLLTVGSPRSGNRLFGDLVLSAVGNDWVRVFNQWDPVENMPASRLLTLGPRYSQPAGAGMPKPYVAGAVSLELATQLAEEVRKEAETEVSEIKQDLAAAAGVQLVEQPAAAAGQPLAGPGALLNNGLAQRIIRHRAARKILQGQLAAQQAASHSLQAYQQVLAAEDREIAQVPA